MGGRFDTLGKRRGLGGLRAVVRGFSARPPSTFFVSVPIQNGRSGRWGDRLHLLGIVVSRVASSRCVGRRGGEDEREGRAEDARDANAQEKDSRAGPAPISPPPFAPCLGTNVPSSPSRSNLPLVFHQPARDALISPRGFAERGVAWRVRCCEALWTCCRLDASGGILRVRWRSAVSR